ncbi:MAG TPA: multiheme c-type cytochrome [Gemmataceae bacterium]|nr:multiheme c-type cytochrome [Gemmataceae bacterium]
MPRPRWIIVTAVAVCALAVCALAVFLLSRAHATTAPSVTPLPAPATPRAVGVAGCSGRACHGGSSAAGAPPPSLAAATFWFENDRHVQAFAALSGEPAERILAALHPANPPQPATRDDRCLACHTNPTTVYAPGTQTVDNSAAARALRRDGVSCEACHGNAGPWLSAHTSWGGQTGELPATYKKHEMTWLNDLTTRADVCAGCHVGAPADAALGLPLRDVTHRMIAAGHPRLAFELVSYQKGLPRHWVERERTRKAPDNQRPGRAARAWLAGQAAGAVASLRLLEDSASRPNWPEFARYDCYACHHNLDAGNWRRPEAGRRPGQPVGNAWDLSLPLLRQLAAGGPALRALADVREGMHSYDRTAIAAATPRAVQELRKELNNLRNAVDPTVLLRKALRDMTADEDLLAHLRWDDAAQLHLALAAWGDAAAGGPADFAEQHRQLGNVLRFRPANGQSWNSPRGYAPAAIAPSLKSIGSGLDAGPP